MEEHASRRRSVSRILLGAVVLVVGVMSTALHDFLPKSPLVTPVGICLVVLGLVVALWDEVAIPLSDRRTTRRAILAVTRPPRLRSIDRKLLGVFDSDIAVNAIGADSPPYVARDIDSRIADALDPAALDQNEQLLVITGDPKTGKTRTLWEALGVHRPNARIFVVRPPRPGSGEFAATRPLAELAELNVYRRRSTVIWLDDAHRHIDHGLELDVLRRLTHRRPRVLIAITVHSARLDEIAESDDHLARLLRNASDGLNLAGRLSPTELDDAGTKYPTLANRVELERLPEWFAAVDVLKSRYRESEAVEPEGMAVARAAITWQRMGMPSRVDRDSLRALANVLLRERLPSRQLDEESFEHALSWALAPVATHSALVESIYAEGGTSYQAHDAIVTWVDAEGESIDDDAWSFALSLVTPQTSLSVAYAARHHGKSVGAALALRVGIESDDTNISSRAAFNLGLLRWEEEARAEAADLFQLAVDCGNELVTPIAAINLGAVRSEQGDLDAAVAAYDLAIVTGDVDVAPMAMVNLGLTYERQNRLDDAKSAFRLAIQTNHGVHAPSAASNLGRLLFEQRCWDDAEEAFKIASEKGDEETAARANLNLGLIHIHQDRAEDAVEALHLAIASNDPEIAPAAAGNLGLFLKDQGCLEEAEAALQIAFESGHPDFAPMAAGHLGSITKRRGLSNDAIAEYEWAVDSGHPEIGPMAANDLGVALDIKGDPEGAEAAYALAIGSANPETSASGEFNLSLLRISQGRLEDAIAALQRAKDAGATRVAPKAAIQLGVIHGLQDHWPEFAAELQYVIDNGEPDDASLAGFYLFSHNAPDGIREIVAPMLDDLIAQARAGNKMISLGISLALQGLRDEATVVLRSAVDGDDAYGALTATFYLLVMSEN